MKTLHPNQVAIIETPNKLSNPKTTVEFKPVIVDITSNEKSETKSEILVEKVNENKIENKENCQPILTYQKPTLDYLNPEEKAIFDNLPTKIKKALNELSTFHCHLN